MGREGALFRLFYGRFLILKHNAQDITLDVAYYPDGYCNCTFSLEEIEGLAKLKIPIRFSVYC